MGDKAANDVARELMFTTTSDREAHAVAVQALLARNKALRTNDELIADGLRTDPEFCDEWRRTGPARAVATALVRYRCDHDLAQRELADRLRMAHSEVARLELGEENPNAEVLRRLSDELGIEVATEVRRPGVE